MNKYFIKIRGYSGRAFTMNRFFTKRDIKKHGLLYKKTKYGNQIYKLDGSKEENISAIKAELACIYYSPWSAHEALTPRKICSNEKINERYFNLDAASLNMLLEYWEKSK